MCGCRTCWRKRERVSVRRREHHATQACKKFRLRRQQGPAAKALADRSRAPQTDGVSGSLYIFFSFPSFLCFRTSAHIEPPKDEKRFECIKKECGGLEDWKNCRRSRGSHYFILIFLFLRFLSVEKKKITPDCTFDQKLSIQTHREGARTRQPATCACAAWGGVCSPRIPRCPRGPGGGTPPASPSRSSKMRQVASHTEPPPTRVTCPFFF